MLGSSSSAAAAPCRILALVLAASQPAGAGADLSFHERALKRANEDAPNTELINLFRAAVFLDDEVTPQSWSNLGVALLHQAGKSKGAQSERHGLWSLIALELSRRMDPLGLEGAHMVDANINLLREKCPPVDQIIDTSRRAYWRG